MRDKFSIQGRGGARRRLPVRRLWVPAFAVVLAIASIVRARYGVDFSDSSHEVALAIRMAQGDLPFRDEMNVQVLGSWPAVPFVWAWLHTAGLDGVVLASRVWFIVLSVGCGYAAWRAVAPLFGRGTTALALGVALIPAAYNQQVVSYNTTPALMYLVSACAGTAAVTRRSLGWGLAAGATAALAAFSHPVTTPAAVVLAAVVLIQVRERVLVGVLAGLGAVTLVVGFLAVFVWGVSSITQTVEFTQAYQALRPAPSERLAGWVTFLGQSLASPAIVAALALSVLAAVPALRRLRTALLLGGVLLTGIHALDEATHSSGIQLVSWVSGFLGTILLVVLLPPALVCAARRRGPLLRMVSIGLAPTVVGLPLVAAFTSSYPLWGATSATLAPGLFAVVVASLVWVERDGRVAKALVAAVLLVSLGTVHVLNSFRDEPLDDLVATVPHGAFAGLKTTEPRRELIQQNERALAVCARPGDGVLAYFYPAAFLLGDVRFDTPIVWLDYFGSASEDVLSWMDRTSRRPECVVAARNFWPGFGPRANIRQPDPLRDWVVANYRPVSETSAIVVLRYHG